MAGRPVASHAVPKVWKYLEELGHVTSHRSLMKIRNENPTALAGNRLTNRFWENNFKYEGPRLVDLDSAVGVVEVLNSARKKVSLPALKASEAVERFQYRITGFNMLMGTRHSEEIDIVGDLATKTSLPIDIIRAALSGRLLPEKLCHHVVFLGNLNGAKVIPVSVGIGNTPISDSTCLANIFAWLST